MTRLAICSRDLHWHWIYRTLLCDTMEVSMLSRAWLTIAQHVFQPALTGRPELISRKIVSGELRTKAIADFAKNCLPRIGSKVLPRFREKYRALGRQKNGVQHATAIYPIPRYTRPRYIGLTLYIISVYHFDTPNWYQVVPVPGSYHAPVFSLTHNPHFASLAALSWI